MRNSYEPFTLSYRQGIVRILKYVLGRVSHYMFLFFAANIDVTNDITIACIYVSGYFYDGVIKWKHFPRYWSCVRGIHRSPANSPHKGQWRWALMFSLICAWTNSWADIGDADDLKHHRVHYDVTVMLRHDFWLAGSGVVPDGASGDFLTNTYSVIKSQVLFNWTYLVEISLWPTWSNMRWIRL